MKFGMLGGAILLILTLIFSYIAIQNNKLAREITINSFGMQQKVQPIQNKQEIQPTTGDNNDTNITKPSIVIETKAAQTKSKWDKFDEKFKDFDEKFKSF